MEAKDERNFIVSVLEWGGHFSISRLPRKQDLLRIHKLCPSVQA
jgi:hypothetical protein